MSQIDFRPAVSADLPALHALVESAYRGDSARRGWTHEADMLSGPRTDQATLAAVIASTDQQILLAVEDGAIIGCVQVSNLGAPVGYLGLLAVEPGRQADGLGQRLMSAAEAEQAKAGADAIELTVIDRRPELIAYYERRGYTATGEKRPLPVDVKPPIDVLVMVKPL